MKKQILTVMFIGLVAIIASAQMSGGIKAGLNLANQSGDDVSDNSMRTAFHAGVYATFNLSDKIALQPELLYNSTGSKYDFGLGEDVNFITDYVSIPVMLLYNINENFNIQAGPQFSFLTKGEVEFDGDTEDISDQLKGTDIGINFGIGANFGKLNATARYCLGLGTIVEEVDGETADVKNAVIQISVGYRLFGGE
jgi:hypothetical protein